MCLAVPGQVIELHDQGAVVDVEGNRVDVVTTLVPDAQCGDYVLVHAGLAIAVISSDDYQEHRRILREIEHYAHRALEQP